LVVETDGGPPFNSAEWRAFLKKWGIKHRLSSAGYPQSNGRAELAVKTAKRVLSDNVTPSGTLDRDAVVRAFLQYKNTPVRGLAESPAQIIYGHPIRDSLPQPVHPNWVDINDGREMALRKRKMDKQYDYNEHTQNQEPLKVGDYVQVQNMEGTKPGRWDRTARVAECLNDRQYTIVMDGSRRVRLKNRRFLRKISPLTGDIPLPAMSGGPGLIQRTPQTQPGQLGQGQSPVRTPTTPAMQPGDGTITPLKRPGSGPASQYPNPRRLEFDETVRTETPEMIMDVGTDSPDVEVDQQESARPVRNRRKPARFNDYVLTQQSFSRHERLGGGVGYSGQTSERFRDFGCNVGRGVTKAKTEVFPGRRITVPTGSGGPEVRSAESVMCN